jgi:hypothetical protein
MDFIRKFAKDTAFKIGQHLIGLSESIPDAPPAPIVRVAVDSGHIVSVGYRASDWTLEIEYHSGRVYQYANVPAFLYEELLDTPSVGRFVNHEIKPFYPATEIKE